MTDTVRSHPDSNGEAPPTRLAMVVRDTVLGYPPRAWAWANLDISSHVWLVRGLAIFAGALVVLFLRRPEALTIPEFWGDEAKFYELALWNGPLSMAATYAGYYSFVQRVIALLEVAVPPVYAPLLGNVVSLVTTALVAVFLASERMSQLIPDRRWRVLLAFAFVLLPASQQMLGSTTDIQWIVGVYLVAMLVVTPPTSTRGRIGDVLGLLVAGLTGPTSILLWPLFALRALRDRRWLLHLIVVSETALIQLAFLATSFRSIPWPLDVSLLPEIVLHRAVVTPIVGMAGPAYTPLLGIVVLAALVLAVVRLPRRLVLGALWVAVVFPLAGMRSSETPTWLFLEPPGGERYFYLAGIVYVGLIIMALSRGYRSALPAAVLLLLGILVDARIPPDPVYGWAENATCIGGEVPCVVPVYPIPRWDVTWPGR
jgi:hypothetical protein